MSLRYTAAAARFATLDRMEQATPAIDPRYPIGRFERPETITAADRSRFIGEIAALPGQIRASIAGLSEAQLDTPYREGGWTLRQVIHHLADSHINSFIRFKLALTEESPTITAYKEGMWAECADSRGVNVEASLAILEGLHERWVTLLKSLSEADFDRTFRHPERGLMRLDVNLALYAWHGKHHTAHIRRLRDQKNW
jgi:hypothetical protein